MERLSLSALETVNLVVISYGLLAATSHHMEERMRPVCQDIQSQEA